MPQADGSISFYFFDVDDNLVFLAPSFTCGMPRRRWNKPSAPASLLRFGPS